MASVDHDTQQQQQQQQQHRVERSSAVVGRSRAPEIYGFVAWTSTSLAFCIYVLWALVPDEYIIRSGITWYPSREWAILVPAWSIVLVLTTYVVYWSLAIASTPSFSDMSTITDGLASFPQDGGDNPFLDSTQPAVLYDMPIGLVNRAMYRRSTQPS